MLRIWFLSSLQHQNRITKFYIELNVIKTRPGYISAQNQKN